MLLGEKAKEIESRQKQQLQSNLSSPNVKSLSYEDKVKELINLIRKVGKEDKAFFIYSTHRLSYLSDITDKTKREIILDELLMQTRERLIRVTEEEQVKHLEKKVTLKEQLLSIRIFIGNIKKLSRRKSISKSQKRELKIIDKKAEKLKLLIEKKLRENSNKRSQNLINLKIKIK